MSDEASDERPVVTRYSDYRAFLRAMIVWLKAHRRGFSYRSFAMKAGFSSPSFLKLVADGQRNLSPDSIERVAQGLGLDKRETEAFEALVELGQAESDTRKNRAYARLSKLASRDPLKRLEADQYDAYSRWYTFVLRELAALPDFSESPEALAKRLRFKTRPEDVTKALATLERLGLLVQKDGKLVPAERNLTTGPEVRSLAVRNFHRQMFERAIESLDLVAVNERNVSGVTVPLSRRQYGRVIDLLQNLRREVLAISEDVQPEDEPQEVHQLAFALFPLTQPPRGPR